MKQNTYNFLGLILIILSGCSGTKYLESARMAETALQEDDYKKALEIAESTIEGLPQKQKPEHGQIYALAGNSAFALEQFEKSRDYLEKARQLEYANESMYLNLAANYRKIDNLSREIGVLEDYVRIFPNGVNLGTVQERLFQTCRESMNYEQAMDLWPKLDEDARHEVENNEIFLEVNKELGNDSTCNALASGILKQYGDNEVALKYLSEKYFWKAEDSYVEQMKAYKENRTRKQYAILLKEFKIINSDYKKSLDYFTRLYKLNPDPGYADYLANIYTRMEDEQKAKYYRRKAEQD